MHKDENMMKIKSQTKPLNMQRKKRVWEASGLINSFFTFSLTCFLNMLFLFSLLPDHGCRLCGDGWITFGRSCFFLSTFRLKWHQSKQNCTSRGGSLAVIASKEVQVNLITFMPLSPFLELLTICLYITSKQFMKW